MAGAASAGDVLRNLFCKNAGAASAWDSDQSDRTQKRIFHASALPNHAVTHPYTKLWGWMVIHGKTIKFERKPERLRKAMNRSVKSRQ